MSAAFTEIPGASESVKRSANGFNEGDVYFGTNTGIGLLSADGSQSNLTWCTLTNAMVTNSMDIRGGLYIDQTGVFSNDLIALASDSTGVPPLVWLVNSGGNPSLLAQVEPQIEASSNDFLEGLISLPDETNQWGPWAGKILTGDEDSGILYTIDTNGVVAPYDLGIAGESFAVIPTNEDLYVCDEHGGLFKVSKALFANYTGKLLISQEGGGPQSLSAELFIVSWDPTNSVFVSQAIDTSAYGISYPQEDATFAPINLPSQ